ncbi:hypothetical protein A0H76_1151 [Hepatospora eriocheir]|uniref:Uncharacterized protein n=1 Tax=Hepatospora eriocheir TaxID=1081669 RepID=A0A1X0QHK7_9MICR|nr:hypothetical protein A0H76_1151 [Hepatospora eriocheir]
MKVINIFNVVKFLRANSFITVTSDQIGDKVHISQNDYYLSGSTSGNTNLYFKDKSQATEFTVKSHSKGVYLLYSSGSDYVIDKSKANKDAVTLYKVHKHSNQLMYLESDGNKYRIKVRYDGLERCLENRNNILVGLPCSDKSSQYFKITASNVPPTEKTNTKFYNNLMNEFYLVSDTDNPLNEVNGKQLFKFGSSPLKFTAEPNGEFYRLKIENGKYVDTETQSSVHFDPDDKRNSKLLIFSPIDDNKTKIIESVHGRCLARGDDDRFVIEDCNPSRSSQEFSISNDSIFNETFYLLPVKEMSYITNQEEKLVVNSDLSQAGKFAFIPTKDKNEYRIVIFGGDEVLYVNRENDDKLTVGVQPLSTWLIPTKGKYINIRDPKNKYCITQVSLKEYKNTLSLRKCQGNLNTQMFRKVDDPAMLVAEELEKQDGTLPNDVDDVVLSNKAKVKLNSEIGDDSYKANPELRKDIQSGSLFNPEKLSVGDKIAVDNVNDPVNEQQDDEEENALPGPSMDKTIDDYYNKNKGEKLPFARNRNNLPPATKRYSSSSSEKSSNQSPKNYSNQSPKGYSNQSPKGYSSQSSKKPSYQPPKTNNDIKSKSNNSVKNDVNDPNNIRDAVSLLAEYDKRLHLDTLKNSQRKSRSKSGNSYYVKRTVTTTTSN